MKDFYCQILGTGNINIILLNGWGMNSKIWFFVIKKLRFYFKFYLIDLPGLGKNKNLNPIKIDEIIKNLYYFIPKNSILLGWSIGGLIASYFALCYPESTLSVISVCSSPYFIKQKKWPGIEKKLLKQFYLNLEKNYHKTIENFLNIQVINSKTHFKDVFILKKILFIQEKPNIIVLKHYLNMLFSIDLREKLASLQVPLLRIYGSLDNLAPKEIAQILDKKIPKTKSIIIEKAGHAPFISHKNEFCSILINFKKKLKTNYMAPK